MELIVSDNGQHAILSNGPAHVQMAVGLGGQLHQRVVDAALDVAGCIGAGNDNACGAAARNTEGDAVAVVLEHRAHQAGPRQQAAQGGAAGGTGGVQFFSGADDIRRIHTAEYDAAVLRQASDQFSHNQSSSNWVCCLTAQKK